MKNDKNFINAIIILEDMGVEEYLNDVKGASLVGTVAGLALTAGVAAYPEGRDALMQQPLYAGALVFGTGVAIPCLHTLAEVTKYALDRAYDLGVESAQLMLSLAAYGICRIGDFYSWLATDENQSHRL